MMKNEGTVSQKLYANVIMPLKLRGYISYGIPEGMRKDVCVGSRVRVPLKFSSYSAVVAEITDTPGYDPKKIKEILEIEPLPKVRKTELAFWKAISGYYMCSIGEVFKAASPYSLHPSANASKKEQSQIQQPGNEQPQNGQSHNELSGDEQPQNVQVQNELPTKELSTNHLNPNVQSTNKQPDSTYNVPPLPDPDYSKPTPTINITKINPLSEPQSNALAQINTHFTKGKTVLLKGVTGSGKTEIYIHLIKECLENGKNALYLLPEVAVSRQLSQRLEDVFGEGMAIYHSKQSIAKRKKIVATLSGNTPQSILILGLRSSLFLPYQNLGLIIVDEEHDSSYKQSNPAPRYNGRDAAIILGQIHKSNVILGSATPSFESEYNVISQKYGEVLLPSRFHESEDTEVVIVDMIKERRKNAVKSLFSLTLIKEIKKRLEAHEQILIFRSRRAYSPLVQCSECGDIPKCPHCNTHLTFHKFNGRLSCHYCGYSRNSDRCPSCKADAMKPLGAGTERVEEELRSMFPEARIARFDADTTERRSEGEKILKSFAKGETDILVGTQMISKGFDFGNLTLVAVMQGESILAINDFRSDEKAFQLLTQLKGRVGRREKRGMMLIQTSQASHPVYTAIITHSNYQEPRPTSTATDGICTIASSISTISPIFSERKEFGFPPFVRMIGITIKDRYAERGMRTARQVEEIIKSIGIRDYSGPIAPPLEMVGKEHILQFIIRLQRNKYLEMLKRKLYDGISEMEGDVVIDVDPL